MRNVPACRIYRAFNSLQSIEFFCFVAFGLQKKAEPSFVRILAELGIGAICIKTGTKQQIFPRL